MQKPEDVLTTVTGGNSGWVRVDDDLLPGPLYLRLKEDRGRWYPVELYLDGRGQELTQRHVREVPLTSITTLATQYKESREELAARLPDPGPDLSRLASYYRAHLLFGDHWVTRSMLAQDRSSGEPQAPMAREPRIPREPHVPPPLPEYTGEMTDDFLRAVAAYYQWCVGRRLKPAPTLAAAVHAKPRTVQHWFYIARKAGILPPARPGRAG